LAQNCVIKAESHVLVKGYIFSPFPPPRGNKNNKSLYTGECGDLISMPRSNILNMAYTDDVGKIDKIKLIK
jgi:hypothetical protein